MEFNATLSLLFFYLISSSLLFRMGEQGEIQKNHGREGIFTYLIYARSNMLCSDPNGVSVGNQQHQTQIHRPLDLNILSFFFIYRHEFEFFKSISRGFKWQLSSLNRAHIDKTLYCEFILIPASIPCHPFAHQNNNQSNDKCCTTLRDQMYL